MPRAAKSRPNLTPADYELLAKFRYTLRKFLGFSEAAALKHGVMPQQYQALLAIEGFPGRNWVSVGELAEQMQVAHHSAVGLVDRMQTLGLVTRAPSSEDGRRVQVSITKKGRSILEKLYLAHRKELQSVGPELIGLLRRAAVPAPGTESDPSAPGSSDDNEPPTFYSPACSMPEIKD